MPLGAGTFAVPCLPGCMLVGVDPGTMATRVRRPAKTSKRAEPPTSRHPLNRPRSRAEAAAIDRLRTICTALPDVTEKIAWGEPTWRAGKMFAQMETHHHDADRVAVWLPARPGVQEALVDEDPVHYSRPPYVGQKGWIGVRIDRKPDWRAVAGLVAEAYREVASPEMIARLDAKRHRPHQQGGPASRLDTHEDRPPTPSATRRAARCRGRRPR